MLMHNHYTSYIDDVKLPEQGRPIKSIWSRGIQLTLRDQFKSLSFYLALTKAEKNCLNLWVGKTSISFSPTEKILLLPFYNKPITLTRNLDVFDQLNIKIPTNWTITGKPNSNVFLDLTFDVTIEKDIFFSVNDNSDNYNNGKLLTMFEYFALLKTGEL
jgi:hypothetical protein